MLEKLPLLALSAASAVITMQAQQAGGAVRTTAEFSFGVRLANAIYAYAMYLWKMVWPAHLAPLYPHPGDSLAAWQVIARRYRVLIAISALCWQIPHAPLFARRLVVVSGNAGSGDRTGAGWRSRHGRPLRLHSADRHFRDDRVRRRRLGGEKKFGVWPAIPAAIILLRSGAATHRQIGYWQSNDDLWSHTLAVTQNNFVAEDNLGGALILEGKEEEAHPHFEAAARINPKDPMSRSNLGTYFQTHDQMREAIAQYEAAVASDFRSRLCWPKPTPTSAPPIAPSEKTSRRTKTSSSRCASIPTSSTRGSAWACWREKQGKLDEAISDLSRSVELQPTAQGYFELGTHAGAGRATSPKLSTPTSKR